MAALFTVLLGFSAFILSMLLTDFAAHVPQESFQQYQTLSLVMMGLMTAVVLVSFAISYFVVSRIRRIGATAHDIIMTKDLSRRIAIDTQWDDLSSLAQLLNCFLAQIEHLMISVREVSNNIAHDLRTPLTGLRSEIESLKGSAVEEHHLDALIYETDKIIRVFQSLLRITNIERGKRSVSFKSLDMQALLHDVAELYEPVAQEKHVNMHIDCSEPYPVLGDADLLFQLFANVLDNAVKFSPVYSTIELVATQERGQIFISVKDQGIGITEHEKEKVFKHFYRGDASRSTEGNGLGLSLAKAIVEQHQGHIMLEDANPGLNVVVSLKPYQ